MTEHSSFPFLTRIAFATLLACVAAPSFAQSCSQPQALQPGQTIAGSTCGGDHAVDAFCDGTPNPGPNAIYTLDLDRPHEGTFYTGSSAPGFAPAVYLMDANPCTALRCVGARVDSPPAAATSLPAGRYWIVVAAEAASAPGSCGSFMLGNDLHEADTLFASGFE